MRKIFNVTLIAVLALFSLTAKADADVDAARALAGRIIPCQAKNIDFVCAPSESEDAAGKDYYKIEDAGKGKIRITANNANSMAAGLNAYLRHFCNIEVTWFARDKVSLTGRLPEVGEPFVRKALCKDRFFLNYCTYGYSLVYWNWEEWERLIDWMALNGINMCIAQTGQEKIWQNVWMKYGLSEQQTREYFTGPAFLPWHRMSNIDAWHGPLPQKWIDAQAEMQKQIVAREVSLGIAPILSAFNGHVPYAFKELHPEADIKPHDNWGPFHDKKCNCWYLDAEDPLYPQIQADFLAEQKALYGKDCHIYGLDIFNELIPPSWEPEYLAAQSKKTYESLAAADPDAIWLQMGWLFWQMGNHWTPERIKAYLEPVPKGKLLMLDYYCERKEVYDFTDGFYGQDFIWSLLANFGGNMMMDVYIDNISKKLDRLTSGETPSFAGVGATLESLSIDYYYYEYVFDRAWERTGDDYDWARLMADTHYGAENAAVRDAWKLLYEKVFIQNQSNVRPPIADRPHMELWDDRYGDHIDYSNADLLKAWGMMLDAKPSKSPAYRFDCVNFARQCIENYAAHYVRVAMKAYDAKDLETLRDASARVLGAIEDVDYLVGTNAYFLAGKWIGDARRWGDTPEEKEYYEEDARLLITSWGEPGSGLNGYANRSYNGMVRTHYLPRWQKFYSGLISALESGKPFDYGAFHAWDIQQEWDWSHKDRTVFPDKITGDPCKVSRQMYEKYSKLIK